MCDQIPIDIELGEAGLYYGTSKAMKGLLVIGKSIEEVMQHVPKALEEMRSVAADHSATEFKPDWKLTPTQDMAVRLSIALCKHIPAWPGATDEQLEAVTIEILKSN